MSSWHWESIVDLPPILATARHDAVLHHCSPRRHVSSPAVAFHEHGVSRRGTSNQLAPSIILHLKSSTRIQPTLPTTPLHASPCRSANWRNKPISTTRQSAPPCTQTSHPVHPMHQAEKLQFYLSYVISVSFGWTNFMRPPPTYLRDGRQSASVPATPVGGATAELSSLASICSRTASGNPNRPSYGQRSGRRPKSGKGRSRYPSSLLKKSAAQLCWTS